MWVGSILLKFWNMKLYSFWKGGKIIFGSKCSLLWFECEIVERKLVTLKSNASVSARVPKWIQKSNRIPKTKQYKIFRKLKCWPQLISTANNFSFEFPLHFFLHIKNFIQFPFNFRKNFFSYHWHEIWKPISAIDVEIENKLWGKEERKFLSKWLTIFLNAMRLYSFLVSL